MAIFGIRFQAKGEVVPSASASIGDEGQYWRTYEEAEIEGSRYLAHGTWRSFTIEKRYHSRALPEASPELTP